MHSGRFGTAGYWSGHRRSQWVVPMGPYRWRRLNIREEADITSPVRSRENTGIAHRVKINKVAKRSSHFNSSRQKEHACNLPSVFFFRSSVALFLVLSLGTSDVRAQDLLRSAAVFSPLGATGDRCDSNMRIPRL